MLRIGVAFGRIWSHDGSILDLRFTIYDLRGCRRKWAPVILDVAFPLTPAQCVPNAATRWMPQVGRPLRGLWSLGEREIGSPIVAFVWERGSGRLIGVSSCRLVCRQLIGRWWIVQRVRHGVVIGSEEEIVP